LDRNQKKCPNAWQLCDKWYEKTFDTSGLTLKELGFLLKACRNLYDFFDSKSIEVEVTSVGTQSTWFWHIREWLGNGKVGVQPRAHEPYFDSRTEAETVGFTKAFEILENQLTPRLS